MEKSSESPLPSSSHNGRMHTRQTVKRKEQEKKDAIRKEKENKRHKKAFQRQDNVIRPNDILSDPQLGKIKLEADQYHDSFTTVKNETESREIPAQNKETVEHEVMEVRIVKEEIDIPNDEQEKSPAFVAAEAETSSSGNYDGDKDVSSTLNETVVQVENPGRPDSLEIKRLGKTLAIRNAKIRQLNEKVNQLESRLSSSTKENDELKNQLLEKDKEIHDLKCQVREAAEKDSSSEVVEERDDEDECNSCPPSPPDPPEPIPFNPMGGLIRPLRYGIPETDNMDTVEQYLNKHERKFDARVLVCFEKVFALLVEYWDGDRSHGIRREPKEWRLHCRKRIIQNSRLVCHSWKQSVDRVLEQDPSNTALCSLKATYLLDFEARCIRRPMKFCNLTSNEIQRRWIRSMTRRNVFRPSYNPLPTRHLMLELHLSHKEKDKLMTVDEFSLLIANYLNLYGAQVWYLTIEIRKESEPVKLLLSSVLQSLFQWMTLIPNLRSLTFSTYVYVEPNEQTRLSQLKWPQFKNLITFQCDSDEWLIYNILKENKTIQKFYLEYNSYSTNMPESILELDAPNMTELFTYYYSKDWRHLISCSWKLEELTLRFRNHYSRDTQLNDIELEDLENFKDSLRTLSLDFLFPLHSYEMQTSLNLPLLKSLRIAFRDLKPVPWKIILSKMKNLTIFQIDHFGEGYHYDKTNREEYVMMKPFWTYTHDMRRAKYWENLPKLKTVVLTVDCRSGGLPCRTEIFIPRVNMSRIKFKYAKFPI